MDVPLASYRPYDPDPVTATGIGTAPPHMSGIGYAACAAAVHERLGRNTSATRARKIVALDLYHAPHVDLFLERFRSAWERAHGPATWIDTRAALKDSVSLAEELQPFLTDDPVFGRVCDRDLDLFFEPERWQALAASVDADRRRADTAPLFVVGPGALLPPLRGYADVAAYAAVPRETIFFASEQGIGSNLGDDRDRGPWQRYKRSFYVDWPVQNRHLFGLLPACDLLIDMHDAAAPSFVDTSLLIEGMGYAAQRPFRVRSIFMPGVWGGQRLRQLVPGIPEEWPNCAWGFEVVAPENSVQFEFAGISLRVAFDLFLHVEAARIMGRHNHRRFGAFFPIRYDFLDTIGGTNLSCQVHPPDAYINAHFREPLAQDEMYYILEAQPGARVYLGLQESTSREAFLADVAVAQNEQVPFTLDSHVQGWDAAPGDLFVIPAGTVHCSGADNLVLEISATPYIYTFKIYDYLRRDLNGEPRPISYRRAFEVIDFGRTTLWTREHLLARPRELDAGDGWRRVLLSASDQMFYTVERIELTGPYRDTTDADGFHMLCVVAGRGARIVREVDGVVLALSYAETGIVPAACGAYRIEPLGDDEVKVIKCFVQP